MPPKEPQVQTQGCCLLGMLCMRKGAMTRFPGLGHIYGGTRYAQYYGRLNKQGDIDVLETFVLSSDLKVYQLVRKVAMLN